MLHRFMSVPALLLPHPPSIKIGLLYKERKAVVAETFWQIDHQNWLHS